MKQYYLLLLLMLLPTMALAQASGGQVTRPVKKQQSNLHANKKVARTGSSNQSNVREVYYESTLSAEEKALWEEEKTKAKEDIKVLSNNLKKQGLEPCDFCTFSEGLSWCKNKNGEICAIDRKGNLVLSLSSKIKKVRPFINGFAVVERSSSDANKSYEVGVIDKKGNVIVPFGKYWLIANNSEGIFFAVSYNKSCGYINERGNIVIPFIYETEMGYGSDDIDDRSFHEGLACIKKDGKYGYVDKEGRIVIPPIYQFAHRFSEGLAEVSLENKDGYIDKNGDVVISFSTGIWGTYPFSCGLSLLIKSDNREYFINPNGTTVIKTKLAGDEDNISSQFSEDLVAICPNGAKSRKWGYMDKQGKIVIPGVYSYAGDFSEGLAFVCKKGYSGFINRKGQTVIPFKFHNDLFVGMEFKDGIAPVCHEGKWGYVDKYGNSTFDFE